MKVVILCAGEGERLKPITINTPKPLIKIGDKSILSHIFLSLPDNIDEVLLIIKKRYQKVFEEFLKTEKINRKITIVFQDERKKGTYFALMAAKNFLKEKNKFLVLNGDDIFLKEDLENLTKIETPCYGLSYKKLDQRYRTCDLDLTNQKILTFRKQKEIEKDKEMPCFSGAFTLNKDFFTYKPVFYEDGEAGIPHTLFANNKKVSFLILKEWLQINTKEDIEKATKYLNKYNI